jgi:hypothetical protein
VYAGLMMRRMFEVYAASRPGRPVALLVLVSATLAGTLGLAWLQARSKRALGPEQTIPGTPLTVRVPRGWVADRQDPGSFVLPVRRVIRGREVLVADRQIRFEYRRLPGFTPPESLFPPEKLQSPLQLEPARIGRFPAVQVRQSERRQWRRQALMVPVILRVAVLPNGDLISVRYTPMTDLTLADLHLLDSVCDSLRLRDPHLCASAPEAEQRAGVQLEFERSWQVALAEFEEVPGFFIGGLIDRWPGWALGVFRTFLACGRRPADLLLDFATACWRLPESEAIIETSRREDGAELAVLRHPQPGRNRHRVASVRVVSESARSSVMLFVFTDAEHLAAADSVADRVARQIRIEPLDAIPPLEEAELAGRNLAATLTEAGAVPWWGQLPVQLSYRGQSWRGEESVLLVREPTGRNPVRGYRATIRRRFSNGADEHEQWRIDGRGIAYEFATEMYVTDGLRIGVREARAGAEEPVSRLVTFNDVERYVRSFRPGPTFICPPLEGLAEAWVARQNGGFCVNESSTLLGRGTCARLLRNLPADGPYARVLVLEDFCPFGTIVAVDDEWELQYRLEWGGRWERVSKK